MEQPSYFLPLQHPKRAPCLSTAINGDLGYQELHLVHKNSSNSGNKLQCLQSSTSTLQKHCGPNGSFLNGNTNCKHITSQERIQNKDKRHTKKGRKTF